MHRLARALRRAGLYRPGLSVFRTLRLDTLHRRLTERRMSAAQQELSRDPWVQNDAGIALRVIPNDVRAARLYASHGSLDRGLLRLWSDLCDQLRPDLLLDVGANYGEVIFSRRYSWKPRLEIFEPLPTLCECLEATIARNSIEDVTIRQVAASMENGGSDLYLSAKGTGRSSLISGAVHASKIRVRTVAIDDAVKPARRLVAKIDVEGHEAAVLAGMARLAAAAERAAIICEFHLLTTATLHEILAQHEAYVVDRYTLERRRLTGADIEVQLAELNRDVFLKDLLLIPKSQPCGGARGPVTC